VNILVYAASPSALQYRASRRLLESDLRLCVSPSQVLAEFDLVVNRPMPCHGSSPSANVFDLQLGATILENRMSTVCACRTDFESLSTLTVVICEPHFRSSELLPGRRQPKRPQTNGKKTPALGDLCPLSVQVSDAPRTRQRGTAEAEALKVHGVQCNLYIVPSAQ
jgi:hypothetical protein